MKSRFAFFVLMIGALAVVALAADVTGTWKAEVPGRDGQTRTQTIQLKQSGDSLTGTVSGRGEPAQISEGKVSGDEISFVVVREMNGNTMKMMYKGKVSGDQIKFTVQREGGEPREFTAKRG